MKMLVNSLPVSGLVNLVQIRHLEVADKAQEVTFLARQLLGFEFYIEGLV